MRVRAYVVIVTAASAGLLLASQLQAQRPAEPRPRGMTLIDVAAVTQKSNRFKQQLEQVKGEMDAAAAVLKKESDRGNELVAEAQKLPADSPKRKAMEAQLIKLRADYEFHGKRSNDDIHEKESKMIMVFNRDLHGELEQFAKATGTPLILRNDAISQELTDPRMILQEIQKNVVYQRDADITATVLETMNRRTPAATAAKPGAVKAPQR